MHKLANILIYFLLCWQAEQAVEKALKSYIERRGKEAQVGYGQKKVSKTLMGTICFCQVIKLECNGPVW